MVVIYNNSKLFISLTVAVAGVVGISYGISNKKKHNNIERVTPSSCNVDSSDKMREYACDATAQVDAVVVDVANAFRIKALLKELAKIENNKAGADEEIRWLKVVVLKLLTTNRGGLKGIHGFIGETTQVHIANINAFINSNEPLYILLNDNSMTDYIRGIDLIQQKACQAGGNLGLDAIKRHKVKYPEFVESGGIYQIPKDMFEKYKHLNNLPKDQAMKLGKEDLRLWKYIRTFTEDNPDIKIESMEISYSDIQAKNIGDTVKNVENKIEQDFDKQRKKVHEKFSPNLKELLKICSVSAAVEGGVSAGLELVKKIKEGKRCWDFTKEDFKDIANKFVLGSGKGALRGGFIYVATNVYKIPAAIAAGIVTATYGIGNEAWLMIKKRITVKQFANNSIFVILEIVASTGGASLGKKKCKKYPCIGAILGSILGSVSVGCIRRTVLT